MNSVGFGSFWWVLVDSAEFCWSLVDFFSVIVDSRGL
jgi:hypothetical protein